MKVPNHPRVPKAPSAKTNTEETFREGCADNGEESNEKKYLEVPPKINENKEEIPPGIKQDPGIDRRNDKHYRKLDLGSPNNSVDRKTARWVQEQNEFFGKVKGTKA